MPAPDAAPRPTAAGPDTDVSAFRDRVHGTNISETTLLATDYLNHFTEIIMLLEMIPDMPEMLEEAKAWQPKGYVEHFETSSCPFRELAIELYPHVPARFHEPFEITILQLQAVVDGTLRHADAAIGRGDDKALHQKIAIA